MHVAAQFAKKMKLMVMIPEELPEPRIKHPYSLKTTIFRRDFDLILTDIRLGEIDPKETIRFDMRQAGHLLRVIERE